MQIFLNEAQSRILIEIAVKDLLPKELEKMKKEKEAALQQSNERKGA